MFHLPPSSDLNYSLRSLTTSHKLVMTTIHSFTELKYGVLKYVIEEQAIPGFEYKDNIFRWIGSYFPFLSFF